jgi:hypothetical protein
VTAFEEMVFNRTRKVLVRVYEKSFSQAGKYSTGYEDIACVSNLISKGKTEYQKQLLYPKTMKMAEVDFFQRKVTWSTVNKSDYS